jgi:hypothetical protein
MPYIKQSRRLDLESTYTECDDTRTCGELNYVITLILKRYAHDRLEGLTYGAINDVLGALEGAKLEFYRRVVVPYESKKIVENGDVY